MTVSPPPLDYCSDRTVPVPAEVTDALAAHLATYPCSGYVFTRPDGAPLARSWFERNVWRPAIKQTGLAGTSMHRLRHTYASALIGAGLSPRVVSERLGHANASLTLNTYAHLWPDDEDRTREAVAAWLSTDVTPMCPDEAEG